MVTADRLQRAGDEDEGVEKLAVHGAALSTSR